MTLVWVLAGIIGWIAFGTLLLRAFLFWQRRTGTEWQMDEPLAVMFAFAWPAPLLLGLINLIGGLILILVDYRREP